jgi:hypothetical protein
MKLEDKMSKLETFLQLLESSDPEFIKATIHEDFFLVREEGLETYDEFVDYVLGSQEEGHEHEIELIQVKCLFEDANSLVVQDLFDSISTGKRYTTITYVTMKDGKFWRAMMNKFEVDKSTNSIG